MLIAPIAQRIERFGSNERVGGSIPSGRTQKGLSHMVGVAQLVRASACGAECCGFESRRPPIEN